MDFICGFDANTEWERAGGVEEHGVGTRQHWRAGDEDGRGPSHTQTQHQASEQHRSLASASQRAHREVEA